jgi:hypothetical protein
MLVDVERSRITVTSTTARHNTKSGSCLVPSSKEQHFKAFPLRCTTTLLLPFSLGAASQRAARGASASSTALVRWKKMLESAQMGFFICD